MAWSLPDPARPAIRFQILDLPVRIDVLFLVVAAVIAAWAETLPGILSGAAAVTLVVLAHELGHAIAFEAFGLRPTIDLYWLGGVTAPRSERELGRLRTVLVAAAGPAAGVAVGVLAWNLGSDLDGPAAVAARTAFWVGAVWGVANLLPIYPLDGGLILIQFLRGPIERRTRLVKKISIVIASAATLLCFRKGVPLTALLPAWLAVENFQDLRRSESKRSLEAELEHRRDRLHEHSVADNVEFAQRVLGSSRTPDERSGAIELLLAIRIAERDYTAAQAVLDEHDWWSVSSLRDLAVVGTRINAVVSGLSDSSPAGDVRLAALHLAMQQDWEKLVELVESPLGAKLPVAAVAECQTRAFRAGVYDTSMRVGLTAAKLEGSEGSEVFGRVLFNVACARARLGQADAAVEALEQAAAIGYVTVEQLDIDEDLGPLRDLPSFSALRVRVRNGRSGPSTTDRPEVIRGRGGAVLGLVGCGVAVASLVLGLPDRYSTDRLSDYAADQVVGLDVQDGHVRWTRALAVAPYLPSPVAGMAYVRGAFSDPREVSAYLLDPDTGRELVRFGPGELAGAGHGIVVWNRYGNGRILAESIADGRELWSRTATPAGLVSIVDGVVVVTQEEASGIEALDLKSGAQLWGRPDLIYFFTEDPAPVVLASSQDADRFYALDPATGSERWSSPMTGRHAVLGNSAWIEGVPGSWTVIDVVTGIARTISVGPGLNHPRLHDGEFVVFETDGGIAGVDVKTGVVLWRQTSHYLSSLEAVGEVIVGVDQTGTAAFDRATGARRWRSSGFMQAASAGTGSIIAIDEELVMALDVEDGATLWTFDSGLAGRGARLIGSVVVVPTKGKGG